MFHVDLGQNRGPFFMRETQTPAPQKSGKGWNPAARKTSGMFPPIHKMPGTESHVTFVHDTRGEEACNSVNHHIRDIENLIQQGYQSIE